MSHFLYYAVCDCRYAKCYHTECRYAESYCAECHYAECRGTQNRIFYSTERRKGFLSRKKVLRVPMHKFIERGIERVNESMYV